MTAMVQRANCTNCIHAKPCKAVRYEQQPSPQRWTAKYPRFMDEANVQQGQEMNGFVARLYCSNDSVPCPCTHICQNVSYTIHCVVATVCVCVLSSARDSVDCARKLLTGHQQAVVRGTHLGYLLTLLVSSFNPGVRSTYRLT